MKIKKMNQYLFKVTGGNSTGTDLKGFVEKLYRDQKWKDLAFGPDEKLPFLVLWSEKDSQIILKLTSKAKKNVDRIESIHKEMSSSDLAPFHLELPRKYEMAQFTWWSSPSCEKSGRKWETLEHKGPYFSSLLEPYEPHGAPLLYDGREYQLSAEEERVATFYARRIISEQSGNVAQQWTKDQVFNKNFWGDFIHYLSPAHKQVFKSFEKVNFSRIVEKLNSLKEEAESADKLAKKIKIAERKENYGFATINGIREPIGNFTVEPAAIFYGRGENPLRGRIKKDILPEAVTINITEGIPIPSPAEGHKWGAVVHNHEAAWIATWKDTLSNESKYVYFSAEGQLKGQSDMSKYEKARKLNKMIQAVRSKYTRDLSSSVEKLVQLGTVLYLIDNFGLRVGNEKDEDETDTVGASTLRLEHVSVKPPNLVVFDFLGKDSIRYYKELQVVDKVAKNIHKFLKNKSPTDLVFHLISTVDINNYLKEFDKDFSAKVFRTRLASTVMSDALDRLDVTPTTQPEEKKLAFVRANAQVAEILNHQRTISTKSKESVERAKLELQDLKKELEEMPIADKKTERIKSKIEQRKAIISAKEDTLHIAVTTSLTNYIDPRLVVTWAKRMNVPISKIYSTALQRKFKWAIDTIDDRWQYVEPVTLVEYTDKSVVLVGDTTNYKDYLKGLGGKFNPHLKCGPGWIFSKSRWNEILEQVAENIPGLQV